MDIDTENNDCLVIMPTEDICSGYVKGHFMTVYNSFIKPSVLKAGLNPVRVDEICEDRVNYSDIIKKVMEASLVLFDLSSQNHAVITALRIRRAFRYRALITIKDKITPECMDTRITKCIEYPSNIEYHNLSLMQLILTKMILDTMEVVREDENMN